MSYWKYGVRKWYNKKDRNRSYTGYSYYTHDGFINYRQRRNGRYDKYLFDGTMIGSGISEKSIIDYLKFDYRH